MNLVPVFGVFFSVVLPGETLNKMQSLGGFIVIFGIYVSIHFSDGHSHDRG